MLRALPLFGIILAVASLPFPAAAQTSAGIIEGPIVERATAISAIIGWTTKNPRGTALHYAIAHYGTNSQNLKDIAKSPNRINGNHADTRFRVLLQGLRPGTTYYYWVESVQANGIPDGVRSRFGQFTTPRGP